MKDGEADECWELGKREKGREERGVKRRKDEGK